MTALLGVHLSDGAVTPPWLAGGFAGAALLLAFACRRLAEDEVPRIGVLTAAFFVATLVHVKLGVTSVHLLLNGLLGVMLGRRAGLAVAVGLTMQYFLVGHGGLSTLGINTCLVGLPAVLGGLLFPLARRSGLTPFAAGFLLGAGTAAATVAGNFAVLALGGKADWLTLARLVLLAHVPVVVVEGFFVGFVVRYLEKVRPAMLAFSKEPVSPKAQGRPSLGVQAEEEGLTGRCGPDGAGKGDGQNEDGLA